MDRDARFEETFLGRSLKALASAERFEIMLLILDEREIGFNQIKKELGLTNGNLAHHIKYLKEAGLIIEKEDVRDKRRHFFVPTPYAERLIRYLFHASEVIPAVGKLYLQEEKWESSGNVKEVLEWETIPDKDREDDNIGVVNYACAA